MNRTATMVEQPNHPRPKRRGASPDARLRIVCEVAPSPEGHAALNLARELAQRWDAELVLVYVAPPDPAQRGAPFVLDLRAYRRVALERGRALLARAASRPRIERARGRVEVGDPASKLASVAAEESAALIVTGESHRRFSLVRWRRTRRLMRLAPCAVVFVRPDSSVLFG